jgi:hypothetical protein
LVVFINSLKKSILSLSLSLMHIPSASILVTLKDVSTFYCENIPY